MKKVMFALCLMLAICGCETKKFFIQREPILPQYSKTGRIDYDNYEIRQRVRFWDDKTFFEGSSAQCERFIEYNHIKLEYSEIGVYNDSTKTR